MNIYDEAFKCAALAIERFIEATGVFFTAFKKVFAKRKKVRLPRKQKKKYKKLGIYDDWKKENLS